MLIVQILSPRKKWIKFNTPLGFSPFFSLFSKTKSYAGESNIACIENSHFACGFAAFLLPSSSHDVIRPAKDKLNMTHSTKGNQRLFSVTYLFEELNIAQKFLWLE